MGNGRGSWSDTCAALGWVSAHPKSPRRQWKSYGITIQTGVAKIIEYVWALTSYYQPVTVTHLSLFLLLDLRDNLIWYWYLQHITYIPCHIIIYHILSSHIFYIYLYHIISSQAVQLGLKNPWPPISAHLLQPGSQLILHLGVPPISASWASSLNFIFGLWLLTPSICMYISIYLYVYIQIYIFVYIYIYIYICMYIYIYICMYIYIYM